MNEFLPDLLIADHRRILSLAEELSEHCAGEDGEAGCFSRFRLFKAMVTAHAKAEEYTIYAYIEENKSSGLQDLKDFVFEGYEEHDIIDLMLKEMGQAEEVTPQFRAKMKVLTDILRDHISEEESGFIPKIREVVGEEELLDLGVVYSRERDDIFAKKSGLNRPAPVHSLSSYHSAPI